MRLLSVSFLLLALLATMSDADSGSLCASFADPIIRARCERLSSGLDKLPSLKRQSDASLSPASEQDTVSPIAVVTVPPSGSDSVATLLPPLLNQVLLTAPNAGALYQAIPRSTKRQVGGDITVVGPDGTVYGVGDPLPSPPVLLTALVVGNDKGFVIFVAPGSFSLTQILLRVREGDEATQTIVLTSVPDTPSPTPSPTSTSRPTPALAFTAWSDRSAHQTSNFSSSLQQVSIM